MFVIGTAGHVDHGKSTLVERLTGIDPDRLREEKERGMTIDLGFAWLRLPGGDEVSIVDVPGHERFVNNMLAGVGGIDLALLVVAADESVMPQTREHTAILDLLQVDRGLAVITKSDLVDDEWLELVKADVDDLLEGTSLEGSPALAVSATTGDGIAELAAAIEARLGETEPRRDLGRPRMAVDRSFTMSGFGTVVTGTLIDGILAVGQSVEIVPTGRVSRIRGLQSHKQKVDSIGPGNRVAANVAGISQGDVARGEVVTVPGWLAPSTAMDVRLQVIPGASRAVRHNMFATVHVGSSETVGRVRLLDCDRAEPGDSAWAQIKFEQPQAVVKGDCFVVRSNHETLGGGRVVDPHAKRHRRNYAPLLERLAVMEAGSDRDVLIKAIEGVGACGPPRAGQACQHGAGRGRVRDPADGVREAGRGPGRQDSTEHRGVHGRWMGGGLGAGQVVPGGVPWQVPPPPGRVQGGAAEPPRDEGRRVRGRTGLAGGRGRAGRGWAGRAKARLRPCRLRVAAAGDRHIHGGAGVQPVLAADR